MKDAFTRMGLLTVAWAVLSGSLLAQADNSEASVGAKPPPLPKGASAWSFVYDDQVVTKIADFNAKARAGYQFKYFFPYAGSLDFDRKKQEIKVSYNPGKISDRYAAGLPAGTLVMPIIDARADKGEFNDWTDAQYQAAASQVAEVIGNDPNAAGVQIDIEPFRESHLPFYRSLRRALNSRGKYVTLYVGPKSEELLTRLFEACDLVVISGYDLDVENSGVERFRKVLTRSLVRVQKAAVKAHGKFMVGIPAAASWGEYEYSVDQGGQNRTETGNKQEDYVTAALSVVREYQDAPEYLGIALWKLSVVKDTDEPEKSPKHAKYPDYIRPSIWEILTEYSRKSLE